MSFALETLKEGQLCLGALSVTITGHEREKEVNMLAFMGNTYHSFTGHPECWRHQHYLVFHVEPLIFFSDEPNRGFF